MSEPFLAEIRMFGFPFAPRGWGLCDGQSLPINQNQSLYSIVGTLYGGDGRTTFNLPDLRGRVPIHVDRSPPPPAPPPGQKGGEETHTLTVDEMGTHTHIAQASTDTSGGGAPTSNVLGSGGGTIYHAPDTLTSLIPATIGNNGDGQAHNNMQPSLAVNFCIALRGLFPPRN